MPPRTTSGFIAQWNVPNDEEVLLKGNEKFDDILDRQLHLIGQMVDASIVLHIYERLKEGTQLKDLEKYFPGGVSAEEAAILLRSPSEDDPLVHEKSNKARLAKLVALSREDRGNFAVKRILNRHLLVNQAAWGEYKAEAIAYHKNSAMLGDMASAAWLERPKDPRIAAANKHISSTVAILDPGPKSAAAISKKIAKKLETNNGAAIGTLGDLNRIAILPLHPKYAEDFIKVLALLFPPKEIALKNGGFATISQTFAERPEVFDHGYYNQKILVAIDHSKKGTIEGNAATIAEVKIVPARMEKAEKMTGIIKGLANALSKSSLFISDGTGERRKELNALYKRAKTEYDAMLTPAEKSLKEFEFPAFLSEPQQDRLEAYRNLHEQLTTLRANLPVKGERRESMASTIKKAIKAVENPYLYVNEGVARRREQLQASYKKIRSDYESMQSPEEKKVREYKFPPFVADSKKDKADAYEALRNQIAQLQTTLHVDAIAAEDRDWRMQYLATVLYQQKCGERGGSGKNVKGFKRDAEKLQETDLERHDFLPNGFLLKIAHGNGTRDPKKGEINLHELMSQITMPVTQQAWCVTK